MITNPQTRRSMPMQEWPEQDRAAWQAAQMPAPFMVKPTPLCRWCDRQRHEAAKNYGVWLGYLERTAPSLLAKTPEARMTAAQLSQFLMERREQIQIGTLAKLVCDLYGVMCSLAPGQDWAWLKQMRGLVSTHAKRQPAKAKAFTHAAELLRIGEELLDAAFAGTASIQDPIAFRDGLILLMLILVPVRITQFSLIRLDQHLHQNPDGEWQLHWQAPETKTRRAAVYPLPPELVEVFQLYIDDVRPRLLARAKVPIHSNALWIGVSGQPIGTQALRKVIETRTKTALDYAVNPHAFRASAASSYAIEAPDHAREASALLDHTNPGTTERYYLLGQREKHLRAAHAALRKVSRSKK
ncbi:MAG: tyrosine-type recombinase/integrase [Betaproteobacteria bacterium]|nr:tyrosine-type recombinase/integrase [Betaproteobacteria bacterium]